ncbi:TrmO family methyltransferase [candidate division CSSED10-310 bacterium]|uniref:TrmO family methyltransferase n=1 Tax=candidate division CSSED10-310 bacterium TaxID=2855610 RepID=A0ABV6Z0Z2_UNCC1
MLCDNSGHKTEGMSLCSECRKPCAENELVEIDAEPVCPQCLYGQTEPCLIYPIGTVSCSPQENISYIDLLPSQKRFLLKLEEENYLTVVYYLHQVRAIRSTTHRRLDGKEVGVFACRTPARLSRIAIQDVKLLDVKGTTLVVEGLDALDGSPVLDIKLTWSALFKVHQKTEDK